MKKQALAYLRTSSSTNVGREKDSDKRQMAAIKAYASHAGFAIVLPPYYDAAVSGADPIESRPGFVAMLSYLAEHPAVQTILVESASRFARDLMIQETGYAMLKARGIDLVAVDSPGSFVAEGPSADLIRQVLGAVAGFERASMVSRLKVARDRKRATTGKCGGRKRHAELDPAACLLACRLRRKNARSGIQNSYRDIAQQLAAKGHLSRRGTPYGASAIKQMLTEGYRREAQAVLDAPSVAAAHVVIANLTRV